MQYLYETHLHTVQASACGRVTGKDYIPYMKSKGYAGIIVTDHFFTGNCAVPQALPWDERVKWYTSGFQQAKDAAAYEDFTVLFSVEFNFDGDEYMLYGVDEKWLLENDDICDCDRREVYKRVHDAGGVMVHAHPYRERGYLSDIKLMPDITDGVEIYNAANEDYQNALGYEYAKKLDVFMTAGSDIHFFHEDALGAMSFERPIESMEDFVAALKAREGVPVQVYDGKVIPVEQIREQTVPTRGPGFRVRWL
ncbi:MAG: PHP domain-containing protein [Lachnospiraceae bacterium]|nr:PHP domain-containing protein [Lachnospiraceae bacterium]